MRWQDISEGIWGLFALALAAAWFVEMLYLLSKYGPFLGFLLYLGIPFAFVVIVALIASVLRKD